jgi:hypothetical protein
LGELETIESYIEAQSFPQKEAYIFGGQKYMQNFYSPLFYVSSKNNFTIFRQGKINEVPSGKPVFFIAQSLDAWKNSAYDSMPSDFGFSVESYKGFGNVGVYKIKN